MTDPATRYSFQLPPLVQRANALAKQLGFPLLPEGRPIGYDGPPSACIPAHGRVLQMLAAARPGGRIGECGTGAGVGTAWLTSGLPSDASLLTVELDQRLVAAVRPLFAAHSNVTLQHGDWHAVIAAEAPFDLLFLDAGSREYLQRDRWDVLTELVTLGGQLVFDDLIPLDMWPSEWADTVDLKRDYAFNCPRVIGAEIRTTATQSSLIITRVS